MFTSPSLGHHGSLRERNCVWVCCDAQYDKHHVIVNTNRGAEEHDASTLSLSFCSSRRRICLMLLAQTVIHQHISLAARCCHGNCQTEVLDQKTFITSFPSPFSPSLLVDVIFSFNFFSFHFYSSDWLFSSIICSFSFSCLFSFFPNNPHSLNWLHYSLLSTCSWRVVSTLVPFFMVAIYEFVQWDSYKNVWSL